MGATPAQSNRSRYKPSVDREGPTIGFAREIVFAILLINIAEHKQCSGTRLFDLFERVPRHLICTKSQIDFTERRQHQPISRI